MGPASRPLRALPAAPPAQAGPASFRRPCVEASRAFGLRGLQERKKCHVRKVPSAALRKLSRFEPTEPRFGHQGSDDHLPNSSWVLSEDRHAWKSSLRVPVGGKLNFSQYHNPGLHQEAVNPLPKELTRLKFGACWGSGLWDWGIAPSLNCAGIEAHRGIETKGDPKNSRTGQQGSELRFC